MIELIQSQKTRSGEIRFLPEHAIQFNRMADGFVNLQTKLATAKNQRAGFFRASGGGVQRHGFFSDLRSVLHQFHGLNQLVTAKNVLAAKTVRIGALLDRVALKLVAAMPQPEVILTLMNFRAAAGSKPGIDFAKLHVRFG